MNREEINALLEKAGESIKGAKILFDGGLFGFSASRAYYAMFYIAEALLLVKDLSFSKHSAVIAAFGEHYSKTNIIDKKYHRYLLDASELREAGDYEATEKIPEDAARETIRQAEEFLKTGQNYLSPLS
ncbi:HEPN domain-containing protein [Candidatus Saganbacteria bacterium]|nr:HEPN domain-containing protein [Candidatus Saganbacteria bacterium]